MHGWRMDGMVDGVMDGDGPCLVLAGNFFKLNSNPRLGGKLFKLNSNPRLGGKLYRKSKITSQSSTIGL